LVKLTASLIITSAAHRRMIEEMIS
jgi:hypothetical protein